MNEIIKKDSSAISMMFLLCLFPFSFFLLVLCCFPLLDRVMVIAGCFGIHSNQSTSYCIHIHHFMLQAIKKKLSGRIFNTSPPTS